MKNRIEDGTLIHSVQFRHPRGMLLAVSVLVCLFLAGANVHAQTFTVLRYFGIAAGDPRLPLNPGLFAQGTDGNLYSTTPEGGTHNLGTVFKIAPSGTLKVLYSFDGTHGQAPRGGLILGTDGNFYGSTTDAGSPHGGTVFRITPSGALTVLHAFRGGSEGARPFAPPVQGRDGAFYGTTTENGAHGFGTFYRLTSSGAFTVIYAPAPGQVTVAPLLQAPDGNFYGVAAGGGSHADGVVYRISPSGAFQVLYNFDGVHGKSPQGGLTFGPDGNLYGTTSQGGVRDSGVIFKVTLSGALTVIHKFGTSQPDGLNPTAGLVLANDGFFYGVTSVSGVLFKMNSTGSFYRVLKLIATLPGVMGSDDTLLQHTNGILYGQLLDGGPGHAGGVFSLNANLPPFIKPLTTVGAVSSIVGILGQGFSGSTKISFGGKPATSVSVKSSAYLTAVVPPGALTGNIVAKTGGATLNSNQKFSVTPTINSFAPPSGPPATTVTITGNALTQTTAVTFGGVKAATFTIKSDSTVTALVPSGAKTGKIEIFTLGGAAVSAATFTP